MLTTHHKHMEKMHLERYSFKIAIITKNLETLEAKSVHIAYS